MVTHNPFARLDAYDLQHFVEELVVHGHVDDLHRVLAAETEARRNAWHEAKESHGDIAGYVQDIESARDLTGIHLATASASENQVATLVGRQYRYALILSSLNSVGSNISNRLLKALASSGIWTAKQSFEYARHISDEEQRVDAIISLGPVLQHHEKLLDEALVQIREIRTVRHRISGIAGLAPYLSETELVHAVEMTLNLDDPVGEEIYQHQALSALVSYLSSYQLRKVLDDSVLLRLGDYSKARLLVTASLRLADENPVDALGLLEKVVFQRDQKWLDAMSTVLVRLAKIGTPELALETAMYELVHEAQLFVLADLISVLPEPQLTQARAIVEARIEGYIVPYTNNDSGKNLDRLNLLGVNRDARAAMLPFLADDQLQAAISWTLMQWEPEDGAEYVSRMADRLPDERRALVYDAALSVLMSNADGPFNTISKRATMLNELIPLLPEQSIYKALEVATGLLREDCDHFGYQIEHQPYETYLARSAIPTLDTMEIRRRFGPGAVDHLHQLLDSFVLLVNRDPDLCLRPVVETFLGLKHVYLQLYTLTELRHGLELPIANQEFELASQLYEAIQSETISKNDARIVSMALVKLAGVVPNLSRDRALQMAVDLAENMSDAEAKANLLTELAEYAPERENGAIVRSALDAVRAIDDKDELADTLRLLAPYMPVRTSGSGEVDFLSLVDDIFGQPTSKNQQSTPSLYYRIDVLDSYLPLLAENGYIDVALNLLNELTDKRRIMNLATILHLLPEPEQLSSFTQSLGWARNNEVTYLWAKSVSEHSQHLDNTLRERLARVILDECEPEDRIHFLPNLVKQIQPPLGDEVQGAIISAITHTDNLSILVLLRACAGYPSPLHETLEDHLWQVLATELDTGWLWRVRRNTVYFRGPQIASDLYALRESLSIPAIEKTYSMASETKDESNKLAMTASLLPYLPESERSPLASEMLGSIDYVLTKYEQDFAIGAPVQLLAAIVPYVPESERRTAIDRLHAELTTWRRAREKAQPVKKMYWRSLEPLTALPAEILFDIWSRILADSQDLDRTHFWDDTKLLLPLLPAVGGKEAVVEACESIRVVARWWP